jgi:hypothetical protein
MKNRKGIDARKKFTFHMTTLNLYPPNKPKRQNNMLNPAYINSYGRLDAIPSQDFMSSEVIL